MPICPQCKKENPELGAKCPRCQDRYYVYDEAADEAERDPYIGQKAADKYVVIARISEGGMGTVYRALQLPVEREVAFKVLRAELEDNDEVRNRFIREARAVSKINHPNIITLHDFGFDASDYPYMVMEYAPGQSLDEWIYQEDIGLERVIHVLRQILSALADAHEQGVVHRDLKPENIMVTGTGTDDDFIKLLDFGIARLVNEQATEGLTREGEVFGTPHYMSPEQAEGETGIGPPADVYALGIMLYEMLCAETPFDAPKPLSILFKQINEELPPLNPRPDMVVPQPVESLLRKATAKDPDARYQTAGEMLEALERIDDPDRSGIMEVANGTNGRTTQRGIGEEQTAPAQTTPAQAGEQRGKIQSREEVATANTLGFEDTNDGTNPPGTGPQGQAAETAPPPQASNDVPVDEPADSLFGLEDAQQGDQKTLMAAIAVLAAVVVVGFGILMSVGGEGESAAATDDSDASSTTGGETVAATDDETGGSEESAATATFDSGIEVDAGTETDDNDDAGSDTGAPTDEQDDQAGGESTPEPAGDDDHRADRDESANTGSTTSGRAGGTGTETQTGSSSGSTGGGRDDQPAPDPTPTPDPTPDPDPAPSAGSSSDSASEDDSETEIEKFGAPTDDDNENGEPTKFGDPDKFGPPE